MPKIELSDIKPNPEKLNTAVATMSNQSLFSPSGIKQFKEIIENIRAMVQEAKELQNPKLNTEKPSEVATNPDSLTKEQVFIFVRQFLDSMVKQGYGDKTISEAINAVPFTINQIRGYLK